MSPRNRVIIDTDPGVDDILAILLALSASHDDLEILMLSATYGNGSLRGSLRKIVATFHVLEQELEWRKRTGRRQGFDALNRCHPIVAAGARCSLETHEKDTSSSHENDELDGAYDAHPDLAPPESWVLPFEQQRGMGNEQSLCRYFKPARQPAHKEMLRLLRDNPADSITIVALGPLTNVALAAAEDPETLLRAKELVVMGGAVDTCGNVAPVAEFNTFADPVAAARVFALTSVSPKSTMPPATALPCSLPAYPERLSRQLKLTLFPLDITLAHPLKKIDFEQTISPLVSASSPLARWVNHWMSATFEKYSSTRGDGAEPLLALHDPLTIWYVLTSSEAGWVACPNPEDIRVESTGQWTRGMLVVDRRLRKKEEDDKLERLESSSHGALVRDDETLRNDMGWLNSRNGNRIKRMVASSREDDFAQLLMGRIFGEE